MESLHLLDQRGYAPLRIRQALDVFVKHDQIFSHLRAPQVFQLLVVQATSPRVPRAPGFLTQRLFYLLGCLPWYKPTIPLP